MTSVSFCLMAVLMLVDSRLCMCLCFCKVRLDSPACHHHHRFILRDKSQVTSDLLSVICDNLMDLTCSCVNAITREHHSVWAASFLSKNQGRGVSARPLHSFCLLWLHLRACAATKDMLKSIFPYLSVSFQRQENKYRLFYVHWDVILISNTC